MCARGPRLLRASIHLLKWAPESAINELPIGPVAMAYSDLQITVANSIDMLLFSRRNLV